MKTINIRVIDGWAKANNKSDYICDICGHRLYVAPDGKTIYCDNQHKDTDLLASI